MSNKTISINPALFSIGSSKSKKNKEKKKQTKTTPLISPNVLKNKLLKRIKEHKIRETENNVNNQKKLPTQKEETNRNSEVEKLNLSTFSDEFSDSINYLQTLSKQKKINDEKANYERQKIKKKEQLERQTVKNYKSMNQPNIENNINLELPDELISKPLIPVNNTPSTGTPIHLSTDSVPYGIMKGGTKPTYRDWRKTQRNYDVSNPSSTLTIQGNYLTKENNEREKRLTNLREKLKQKQQEDAKSEILIQPVKIEQNVETKLPEPNKENIVLPHPVNRNDIIGIKKITTKTIKKKYTLGKNKNKKYVSILVKDRGTRKLILNAQKDLKNKSINQVKEYLREHNFIKIGSNAPNDVLRKLYESAMLAGEITNSSSEILLHNFSKNDKEL
jgi:hypothetical protein